MDIYSITLLFALALAVVYLLAAVTPSHLINRLRLVNLIPAAGILALVCLVISFGFHYRGDHQTITESGAGLIPFVRDHPAFLIGLALIALGWAIRWSKTKGSAKLN